MGTKSKNYNPEVDLLRFVLSFIIMIYHGKKIFTEAGAYDSFFPYAYTAVEFFFIVSGYLMVQSSKKYCAENPGKSTFDFIIHKVKPLYPYILIAFAFTFAVRQYIFSMVPNADISKSIYSDLLIASNEMLLLQQSGVAFNSLFNGPSWYISAMIIAMAILFPLVLSKKTKNWYVNIGGLLIAIAGYAFLSQAMSEVGVANVYTINSVRVWLGFTEFTLMRAVAGVSLGVFTYGIVNRIHESKVVLRPAGRVGMFMVQAFLGLCLYQIWQYTGVMKGGKRFDYIAIIIMFFFCVIVLSGMSGLGRILPAKLCKFLGKISLPLYLNHRAVLFLYEILEWEFSYKRFLVILTLMTLASVLASEILVWLWRTIWCKLLGPRVKNLLRRKEEPVLVEE